MEKDVFISYCQKNMGYVDLLDIELIKAGFNTKRDTREINPWESIMAYMNSLDDNRYVVLVITTEYLESLNCMYEGCLSMLKCKDRTTAHITSGIDIYNNSEKSKYISYWNDYSLQGTDVDKEKISFVKNNVDSFLTWITDVNNPSSDFVEFVEKFKEKVEIDSLFDDAFSDMMEDLLCSKMITISEFVEDPFSEKKYFYEKFDYIPATRGYTFVFHLRDIVNNKPILLQVNNVKKVVHGIEGSNFSKYYFKCLNMDAVKKNMEHEKYGKEFTSEELELEQSHRIIINF